MEQIVYTTLSTEELGQLIKKYIQEGLVANTKQTTPDSFTSPVYLTRKEVATRLKISLPTLNQLTKTGVLAAYRIGGRVLYKEQEVVNSLTKILTHKYKRQG